MNLTHHKSSTHRCMYLWVLLFNSVQHPVCFHASSMHYLLLFLCSTTWNQRWSQLHKFFHCTQSFYLYWVFCLSHEVQCCSFKDCKKCVGDLMGIALNLQIALTVALSTVLIILIQEHGRSFLSLISSLILFLRDLKFLSNSSLPCMEYRSNLVRVHKLYTLCGYCEGCCFSDFIPRIFIVCINDGYSFL